MRLSIRLLAAIWIPVILVVGGFAWVSIERERIRLTADLERRAWLLGESLKEAVEPQLGRGVTDRLERIVQRFQGRAREVAVYDPAGSPLVVGARVSGALGQSPAFVAEALAAMSVRTGFAPIDGHKAYYYVVPVIQGERPIGALAIFLDAGEIERRVRQQVQVNLWRSLALGAALSLLVLLVVRRAVLRPLADMVEWARQLRLGAPTPTAAPDGALFVPLATEVTGLARSLARAQAAMEEEARLRLESETVWTEERLKQFTRTRFGDRPLIVVSNREPFSHVWRGRHVSVQTPASGVVTALDPVMRACGGLWVAHGSGDADREVVDERDAIMVPPHDPRYTLKRVWLTAEQEAGYYYGFSNEGLWPLCHIVHARPVFRAEDWEQYVAVNELFAEAVLSECLKGEAPAVLIQDYHFALLPRLIKQRRPDARIAIFWHIPWPNPEAFGICPWQSQILHGMLGADLLGFHTQFHCNNFLDTVDRAIEARIDWERFSVIRAEHVTDVRPFPISVAPRFVDEPPATSRAELLDRLGLRVEFLGVGVERLDYTKGLPERFAALARVFERWPEYRERLTFVQLAAPSRSRLPRYQAIEEEVEREVEDVNRRFQTGAWRPIVLLKAHHNHPDIWPFYRWADFCMVTSLHDGMNLVAKEFVSVRDDEGGALILSRFTGAARELREALLVNPYDIEQMAEAVHAALSMPPSERQARMARLRQTVREHNIYRWAGQLLGELSWVPLETAPPRVRRRGEET
jgi:trehalose 6-phosphate synthase